MAPLGHIIRIKLIGRAMVRGHPDILFVFGDNMLRRGLKGQAAAMRGEPNALGIPVKWRPSKDDDAYFTDQDADREEVRQSILQSFQLIRDTLDAGRCVVIPADGIGTGLAQLPERAPRIHLAISRRIQALEEKYGVEIRTSI